MPMSRQGEWQSIGIGGAPYSLHVGEQSHGGMHTETHRGSNAAAQRVCIYLTETSRGKAWIDPEEEEDA